MLLKMMLLKETVYDKLAAKVDNIDTSKFTKQTKQNQKKIQTDKAELEKKIPDVTDFVQKIKPTELENEISDVSGLATKTALTTVENKIPDISSLVKKQIINKNLVSL